MLELIVVILLIMWLLGYFGRGRVYARGPVVTATPPFGGSWIHTLLVIILILIILRLLRLL